MKNLLSLLLIFPMTIFSQNTIPAGYLTNSVELNVPESYITLVNNTTATNSDINWDIAFYNNPYEIGGKINEIAKVRVWRVYQDTATFLSVKITDTLHEAFNSNSFSYYGAMDTIYTGSQQLYYNIGLGKYYDTHNAYGDRIYIIKKADGSYGKFFLSSYLTNGRVFTIKYANMDNTNLQYITIPKIVPQVKNYRYLNLTTGVINDNIEPKAYNAWDLKLTQGLLNINGSRFYSTGIIYTNNKYNMVKYSNLPNLPSIYSNPIVSTQAYIASGRVDTVTYNNSLNFTNPVNLSELQIGTSWVESNGLNCKPDVSYYIKTNDNSIYHLIFTSLSGTTLKYAYKKIGSFSSISSSKINQALSYQIADNQLIISSSKKQPIHVEIYNVEGKTLLNINLIQKGKIELKEFPKGMIFVKMNTEDETQSFKIHLME